MEVEKRESCIFASSRFDCVFETRTCHYPFSRFDSAKYTRQTKIYTRNSEYIMLLKLYIDTFGWFDEWRKIILHINISREQIIGLFVEETLNKWLFDLFFTFCFSLFYKLFPSSTTVTWKFQSKQACWIRSVVEHWGYLTPFSFWKFNFCILLWNV